MPINLGTAMIIGKNIQLIIKEFEMSKKHKEYDQNIINALKSLPVPLKTYKGKEVLFDVNKRDETIFEHISNKEHHLFVKDIEQIPKILLNKESLNQDNKSHKFHNYIGRRGKKNERAKYLKIITEIKKGNKESVVTIYVIKNN